MEELGRSLGRLRRSRAPSRAAVERKPSFIADISLSSGDELEERLIAQGLSPDEVVFKYCRPRFAPPPASGIRSLAKDENLGRQMERLIAMHDVVPSSVPMPIGTVRDENGELIGYLLEHVDGETLHALIELGALDEARRQLEIVERVVEALHRKELPHGDINPSNVIAADDGRTLLIDPVGTAGPGTKLQDELCLKELRAQLEKSN